MKKRSDDGFMQAVAQSARGFEKQLALSLWPDFSVERASSYWSRTKSGELNPPAQLLALLLKGPNPAPLLDWIARVGRCEVRPVREPAGVLRERALVAVARIAEQLELIQADLAEADAIESEAPEERRRPLRAGDAAGGERRRVA